MDTIFASQAYAINNNLNVWKDGDASYLASAEYPRVATSVVEETQTSTQPSSQTSANAPQPVQPPAEQTIETPVQTETEYVYYQNCDAVRAAGAAPIYPGDPGFQSKFDRDNDGIGCE